MEAMAAAANKGAILNQRSDFVSFLNPENIQTIQPHQPMIKFGRNLHDVVQSAVHQMTMPSAPALAQAQPSGDGGALEWYQIPARYRKQEIDEAEIEVINMGGPEKPWQ